LENGVDVKRRYERNRNRATAFLRMDGDGVLAGRSGPLSLQDR
jgi:hypothetical protein